jgi:hypothetical protein
MNKWLKEIEDYHDEGDTAIKVIKEGKKVLLYDLSFFYENIQRNCFQADG